MRFLPHLDRLAKSQLHWEGFAKQLLLKNNMSRSQDTTFVSKFVFQSTGCHCFEMTSIHAVGGCGGGRLLLCRSSQSTKQFEGGSEAGDCEALKYTFLTPIKPFFLKPHDLWDPPPLVQCLFVSDSVWCRPATLRAIKMFSGTSIGFTRSYPPCTVVHQAMLMSVEKSILYLSSPQFSKL